MAAGDPRFFAVASPVEAATLAARVGAAFRPRADGGATAPVGGVASLDEATPDEASFLDNRKYMSLLAGTQAGVVVLAPATADQLPPHVAGLVTDEPYLAWAHLASVLYPAPPAVAGIHPSAVVAGTVDPSAEVAAAAVIGAGAMIGAGTRIGEGAVIGAGVQIGVDCRIGPGVSISHAILGSRVTVHPGARIGQPGFGFAVSASGYVSVPQLGRVLIGDDADIGANATIDRGSTGDTVIGAGSRLDNLVQIGHNVRLGRGCVVVAQAGISGSTVLEDHVTVAAQAGLTGHLRIGTKARVGAQAGVMSDVEAGSDVVGSPAMGVREFFRNVATLRRLSRRGGRAEV